MVMLNRSKSRACKPPGSRGPAGGASMTKDLSRTMNIHEKFTHPVTKKQFCALARKTLSGVSVCLLVTCAFDRARLTGAARLPKVLLLAVGMLFHGIGPLDRLDESPEGARMLSWPP